MQRTEQDALNHTAPEPFTESTGLVLEVLEPFRTIKNVAGVIRDVVIEPGRYDLFADADGGSAMVKVTVDRSGERTSVNWYVSATLLQEGTTFNGGQVVIRASEMTFEEAAAEIDKIATGAGDRHTSLCHERATFRDPCEPATRSLYKVYSNRLSEIICATTLRGVVQEYRAKLSELEAWLKPAA